MAFNRHPQHQLWDRHSPGLWVSGWQWVIVALAVSLIGGATVLMWIAVRS